MKRIFLLTAMFTYLCANAQNIGIGTATPSATLHIKGSLDTSQLLIDAGTTQSNAHPLLRLRNAAGTDLLSIHSDDPSNSFIGVRAGLVNKPTAGGLHNTFAGSSAGTSNTSGVGNTAIGGDAMYSNVSGGYNTIAGFQSAYLNKTGDSNAAYGSFSLNKNVSGIANTAIGMSSLYFNTASFNTALGFESLNQNTSGTGNTATGMQAIHQNTTGNGNSANGYHALYTNTTGSINTAAGYEALYSNTTGAANVADGADALYFNTTGLGNTAVGKDAMHYNIGGTDNVALGIVALYHNTGGYFNVAVGSSAMSNSTTGSANTVIGDQSFLQNTAGSYNVAIGREAGNNVSDDIFYQNQHCIFIGYQSHPFDPATGSLSGFDNAIAIGNYAEVDGSNKARIGNVYTTSIGGFANWTNISDGRFKKNIQQNVKGLDFILKLQPVTYNLNMDALNAFTVNKPGANDPALRSLQENAAKKEAVVQTGFIAQDVEKAALETGYNFSGIDKPEKADGMYGLRYAEFVVPLVKAIQEQQAIIKDLQRQIDELKKK